MGQVLQVLLLLSLITLASKGAGALSIRLRQPAVFGEILAGLLLGPSLLNILGWKVFAPGAGSGAPRADPAGAVQVLAEIGVVLLMFVAGMETDLQEMRRVGKTAFWAAFGGVVLPLVGGALAAYLFGYGWGEGFFMGAVLTATSVSISAQTLMELKSLRSREGSTILGAAVIDDVMGIIVLSLVVAFAAGGGAALTPAADAAGPGAVEPAQAAALGTAATIAWVTLRMGLFFVLAWLLGRRYLERIAGVLFAQTSFRERIDRGIHPLTYSFFVPIFFINIGLRADVRQLLGQIPLTVIILAVAILGKVIGCGVSAWLAGFRYNEALRVGVGMISRGEVGLIVAGYGLTHGTIGNDVFSVMVLMVLVTTMITPVWLRSVFPRVGEERAAPVFESVAHLGRR